MSEKPRRRVESVTDAAAFLGVSRQRVQQFAKESPWWSDEFRTADGWDVVGIAVAQAEYAAEAKMVERRTTATTTSAQEQQRADAELLEAVESARIKTLERRKRERVEATEAGKLVAADVAAGLFAESLAELRKQLVDLPYRFWLQCPDEFRSLVFANGSGTPAVLERLVAGVVDGFEAWLELQADELFDSDGSGDLLEFD